MRHMLGKATEDFETAASAADAGASASANASLAKEKKAELEWQLERHEYLYRWGVVLLGNREKCGVPPFRDGVALEHRPRGGG